MRTLNIYSRTRNYWDNSSTWGWGWSTLCTPETKTDCIRRVREVTPHWQLCPAPRPVQVKKSPLSLCFLQWEQRTQGDNYPCSSIVGHFSGGPNLISEHRDFGCPATGNLTVTENRDGLEIASIQFAHLQNQVRGTFWPGNSAVCISAWFQSSKKEFCWCKSLVWLYPDKELNYSHPIPLPHHYGECLLALSGQKFTIW